MQPAALLDTDILSELLNGRNAPVRSRAIQYSEVHGHLSFSAITRYEVMRGYKSQGAIKQLEHFASYRKFANVVALTENVFDKAADLWALAHRSGHPRNDADLLIAATAVENGYVLVIGNASHFQWVPDLTLDDWRNP
jgi:tRNA(fMet)-specific endonuclease VapC